MKPSSKNCKKSLSHLYMFQNISNDTISDKNNLQKIIIYIILKDEI